MECDSNVTWLQGSKVVKTMVIFKRRTSLIGITVKGMSFL